jgi:hypothetical protein
MPMFRVLRTLLAALLLIVGLAAVTVPKAAADTCGIRPYGLIGDRWNSLGADGSPLGCAIDVERDIGGRAGRWQPFQYGQIVWSPDQGGGLVVATWSISTRVFVQWGPTDPFGYDFFIVRWDLNGNNVGQANVENGPRNTGSFSFDSGPGWSSIVVEGCDSHVIGSSTCRQGWTAPSGTRVADPGPIPITGNGDPAQAFNGVAQRTDAAVEHLACTQLLNPNGTAGGEGDALLITAQLDLARRYGGNYHCRGQLNSQDLANRALLGTWAHPTGTSIDAAPLCTRDGEYDTFLKGLMVIIYRYWDLLYDTTRQHIRNDLLTENGPHSVDDEKVDACGLITLPESENHRLLIETAHYLSNQKLHDLTGNPIYDNVANGERDYLLNQLQSFAKYDFLEYNARPYQRYSMNALFDLYDFARDPQVRTGAQIVLDYTTTKFAVSSNQLRRAGPFRRLTSRTDASNQDYFRNESDPQTAFFLAWTGLAGDVGNTIPNWWAGETIIAGLSSYRPPLAAVYRAMTKSNGAYQETFYHGNRPALSYSPDTPAPGIEIYSNSPSFLLRAGGVWLPSGYGNDEWVERFGANENYGSVQSTTLMPGYNIPGVDMTRNNFLRFDGYSDQSPAGRDEVNTCVQGGFACGLQLQVPQTWRNCAQVSTSGSWTFLNMQTGACGGLGFYVAIHSSAVNGASQYGNVGFFDAIEASSMSFGDFVNRTIADNPGMPAQLDPHGRYVFFSADGHNVTFRMMSPGGTNNERLVTAYDGQSFADFGSAPLVQGPYLSSPGHDGLLQIWFPEGNTHTTLDFRNALNPIISQ